jgi:hypothetical protein
MEQLKLDFNGDECVNAVYWLTTKLGYIPKPSDFEAEFRCKITDNCVQFKYIRDYTWFILKWS